MYICIFFMTDNAKINNTLDNTLPEMQVNQNLDFIYILYLEITHFWRGVRTVGGLRSFMGCRQKWRIVAEMYSSATAARLCESH